MSLIVCPKCKAEVSSLSLACPSCGISLSGAPVIPSPTAEARPQAPSASFFELFGGILTAPRQTFSSILEGPRGRYVWTMLFLSAFFSCLSDVPKKGEVWYVFLFPLVAVLSWVFNWIFAWLISKTGGLLGGVGDVSEVYDCLIWALGPGIVVSFIDFIRSLNPVSIWQLGWGVLEFAVSIWAIVIVLMLLSTAHHFSIWMALWNMIIFLVIVFLAALVLVFFFRLLFALIFSGHYY